MDSGSDLKEELLPPPVLLSSGGEQEGGADRSTGQRSPSPVLSAALSFHRGNLMLILPAEPSRGPKEFKNTTHLKEAPACMRTCTFKETKLHLDSLYFERQF